VAPNFPGKKVLQGPNKNPPGENFHEASGPISGGKPRG